MPTASLEARPAAAPESGDFYAPTEWGPYEAGVMELEVRAIHHGLDNLEAWVWYPANVDPSDAKYVYMDHQVFGELTGDAVLNADVNSDGGPYPAIVFSHGNGGVAYQSIFYTEFLASHGYVVISVHHPGNTMLDYRPWTIPTGVFTRPRDVSSQIDALEDMNQALGELLRGLIDVDNVGMTGHSFGGYTTLAASGAKLNGNIATRQCRETGDTGMCEISRLAAKFGMDEDGFVDLSDDRIDAAVPMAPCGYIGFQDAGLEFIDVPIQVQGGGLDDTCEMDDEIWPIYNPITAPKSMLNLHEAGHFAWSDICLIEPDFDECHAPFLNMDEGHGLINLWALSHFKVYLNGDDRYLPYLEDDFANEFEGILTYDNQLGL